MLVPVFACKVFDIPFALLCHRALFSKFIFCRFGISEYAVFSSGEIGKLASQEYLDSSDSLEHQKSKSPIELVGPHYLLEGRAFAKDGLPLIRGNFICESIRREPVVADRL